MNTCEHCHFYEDTAFPFCGRWRFFIQPYATCNYFERWTSGRRDSKTEMKERQKRVGYREEE